MKINDKCIGCGTCASECPVEAIKAQGDKYEIKKDICVGCGNCMSICPNGAIEEE